ETGKHLRELSSTRHSPLAARHSCRENRMSIRRFAPLTLIALIALPAAAARLRAADDPTPKVAHIKLSGDLDESPVASDPLFGGAAENFKSKLDRIRKAAKDDEVK